MPAPVLVIPLFFLGFFTIISFVALFESKSMTSFLVFLILGALTAGISFWMISSSRDLTKNPKILCSEVHELFFDKKNMKQYIIMSNDHYVNATKVFGQSFPEGTKVRCDWYDRTRFGIDWYENNGKDPVLSYILPDEVKKIEKE